MIDDLIKKRCPKCGIELPLEMFNKQKQMLSGLRSHCRNCEKQEHQEYYEKNKEKHKAYRDQHKHERNIWLKQYNELNKEVLCEKSKMRRNKKKSEDGGLGAREYARQYYLNNTDRCLVIQERRRNKKLLLPATLTLEQWDKIQNYFGHKCAYCGKDSNLQQDHFIPVTKNGEYSHNNIIPACKICNCSKSKKSFFEWYPKYKHYSKSREKKILDFLKYTADIQQLTLII